MEEALLRGIVDDESGALAYLIECFDKDRRAFVECRESADAVACFFFSSRRRHTRFDCDWSSDVCSSDLLPQHPTGLGGIGGPAQQRPVAVRVARARHPAPVRGRHDLAPRRPCPVGRGGGSEERRGGEEGRSRGGPGHLKKKKSAATRRHY